MSKLRIAVIGAGHLGRIHARLLAQQPDAELVAVVDPVESARQQILDELNCPVADHLDSIGDFDAAIVAAPTNLHHAIGCDLLSRGKHLLMEKPLASTTEQASALVELAATNECVLQVGHVERFNPVTQSISNQIDEPKYIESRRTGSFTFRSLDVGVVLDLMIHDIELILHFVNSPVTSVQALGVSVFGGNEDMAQARLGFENGCVANLTASRCAMNPERSMNIFCPTMYAGIDFNTRTAQIVRARQDIVSQSFDAVTLTSMEREFVKKHLFDSLLAKETIESLPANPLADEQADFIGAVRDGRAPQVTGAAGRDAVDVAEQICEAIQEHRWNGDTVGPMGPNLVEQPTILRMPMGFPSQQPAEHRKAG